MNFTLKTGDTSPNLETQLTDDSETPIDLTNADVRFRMGEQVDSTATIVDATEGLVEYQWQQTDTSESGVYEAEFEVTYADGEIETFPNDEYIYIRIVKSLDK